jgi:hypothetical protein
VFHKPWGIGFSDMCLPTSDVPVQIMNGQDHGDQLLSATFWDIVVPLDPHRFLLMPAPGSQQDPATRADHRIKLEGMLGIFIWELIWGAAERHVLWHPDHVPYALELEPRQRPQPRLPRPWAGEDETEAPQVMLNYAALPPGKTVERRRLDEHPARRV